MVTSGIRLGSPAMTSRGLIEADFKEIAKIIDLVLRNKDNKDKLKEAEIRVKNITKKYPLWY